MSAIYITEQGAVVHQASRHLVVSKGKEQIMHIPLVKIDCLLIFGNVQVTTQALNLLLDEGIDVSFLTMSGKAHGRLVPEGSRNVPLRMEQYRHYYNDLFSLEVARAIVKSKIRNGKAFINFYQKNHPDQDFSEQLRVIHQVSKAVDSQTSISSLMGSEGVATANYFKAYGKMFSGDLRFQVRTRRPPKDPVNALLSLGYTLLTNEIRSMLFAHSLDPHIGFLHSVEYSRPSLALDLVEEFRHPFIDRFTLFLINKQVLTKDDFRPVENSGVYLTGEALKKYFGLYHDRITEPMILESENEKLTFRDLIKRQVQQMVRTIQHKEPYKPFRMRW